MDKLVISRIKNRLLAFSFKDDECNKIFACDNELEIGDVYVGYVQNIVDSIKASFIDIGLAENAYLALKDAKEPIYLNPKNNDKLNQGDIILVQVLKSAIKSKPASLTSEISLEGNYLVANLSMKGVLLSKKLKKSQDIGQKKDDLEKLLGQELSGFKGGFILRTNSEFATRQEILDEALSLAKRLKELQEGAMSHRKKGLALKAKASYIKEIESRGRMQALSLITDIPKVYKEIEEANIVRDKLDLRYYEKNGIELKSIYSLEKILEEGFSKRVWLKCGAYLVIEKTEAMTVIDVNSGKCVIQKKSPDAKEKAIYKINLEAAREIARQLKLRNLSGMIMVDFINFENKENLIELMTQLRSYVKDDYVKTEVIDATALNIVEITRQRKDRSLDEIIKQEER